MHLCVIFTLHFSHVLLSCSYPIYLNHASLFSPSSTPSTKPIIHTTCVSAQCLPQSPAALLRPLPQRLDHASTSPPERMAMSLNGHAIRTTIMTRHSLRPSSSQSFSASPPLRISSKPLLTRKSVCAGSSSWGQHGNSQASLSVSQAPRTNNPRPSLSSRKSSSFLHRCGSMLSTTWLWGE